MPPTPSGYDTLKEFINDYKAYFLAKEHDPDPRRKTNITKLLRQEINEQLTNATPKFKAYLRNKQYTKTDLSLIATQHYFAYIRRPDTFLQQAFDTPTPTTDDYKRLIQSQAFKDGSLKLLYPYIPLNINGKKDLSRFIKRNAMLGITMNEITTLLTLLAPPAWREWLEELEDEGAFITNRHGMIL